MTSLHLVLLRDSFEGPERNFSVNHFDSTVLVPVEVVLLQATTIFPLLSRFTAYFAEIAEVPAIQTDVVNVLQVTPFVVLVPLALELEVIVALIALEERHSKEPLLQLPGLMATGHELHDLGE